MDPLIDSILQELKDEYGITKYEAERILDSEFKVLQLTMETKELRNVNMIHLGKFKPSKWLKDNKHKFDGGKYIRDIERLVQPIDIKKEDA